MPTGTVWDGMTGQMVLATQGRDARDRDDGRNGGVAGNVVGGKGWGIPGTLGEKPLPGMAGPHGTLSMCSAQLQLSSSVFEFCWDPLNVSGTNG